MKYYVSFDNKDTFYLLRLKDLKELYIIIDDTNYLGETGCYYNSMEVWEEDSRNRWHMLLGVFDLPAKIEPEEIIKLLPEVML